MENLCLVNFNLIYFIKLQYQVLGLKTYFILGRKCEKPPQYTGSFKALGRRQTIQPQSHSLQLIISPPTTPPLASPQTRPRVLSCDNSVTHIKIIHNPNMLSPDVCKIKASSLPSILDEQELENDKDSGEGSEAVKTPTSTASSGRYSVKIKNWKIANFLRKSDTNKTGNELPNDAQTTVGCEEPFLPNAGYQQVPTIIETQNSLPPQNTIKIKSKQKGSFNNITIIDDEVLNNEQKDAIDVKSYISQSRSDIGQYDYSSNDFTQFIRSGSYRSQYGRSPNDYSILNRAGSNRSRRGRSPNFDIVPVERSRSATVAVATLDRPKKSLDVPPRISAGFIEDQLSMAYSVNSRKDSGIKSNSRRSSIQQVNHAFVILPESN